MNVKIKEASEKDLPSIVAIYNEAIEEGGYTADLKPYTVEQKRKWFKEVNTASHGVYILLENDKLIGYFYFSPWRKGRESLKGTAELSFYLAKEQRGKGLGNLILSKSIPLAREKSLHSLLAIILEENERSKHLLEKWGFTVVGKLPNVVNLGTRKTGQLILLCEA